MPRAIVNRCVMPGGLGQLADLHHQFAKRFDGGLTAVPCMKFVCQASKRLGWHTALMHGNATEALTLNQTHPRLVGRRYARRRQPARTATDYHKVVIEALRLAPAAVDLASLVIGEEPRGDDREHRKQYQRADDARREDVGQRAHGDQLLARVHIDRIAGQHAELGCPPEGPDLDSRQTQRWIQQHKRYDGDQSQRDEVEGAIARQPLVDPGDLLAESLLHPVSQHETTDEHGHQCPRIRGEGYEQRPLYQTEQGPGKQGQHHRTGKRQRRKRRVNNEEHPSSPPWMILDFGLQGAAVGLDGFEGEVLAEVESEETDHCDNQQGHDDPSAGFHPCTALVNCETER